MTIMLTSPQNAIRITTPASSGPLSRVRKQFNALVKKLEAERAKLALWREELPKIRALADSEYQPLSAAYTAQRRKMLLALDAAYNDKTLGKKDRQSLSEMICSTALGLVQIGEDDERLKEIYNRHSGGDLDQEMDQEEQLLRAMVAGVTGVELAADTDFSSPAAFMEAVRQQLAANALEADLETGSAGASHAAGPARPAKPTARELRQQAEEAKLKQSVRDIFRKLASALHPDRETNTAEHARKTALMQRANVAYAANDLLGLLELQLEVAQIDQIGLDNLAEDRIKQYNRILTEQVAEIAGEIGSLEYTIAIDMGWEPGRRRTPKAMLQALRVDIAEMRAKLKHLEADLADISNIKSLKSWLRDYRMVAVAPDDDLWL